MRLVLLRLWLALTLRLLLVLALARALHMPLGLRRRRALFARCFACRRRGGRAERRKAVGRLVVVQVRVADPWQRAGIVVLPERPALPGGRHGGRRAAERGEPERVMGEPAGGSRALPP